MPEVTQIYKEGGFEQKVIFIGNGVVSNSKMYYRAIGSNTPFISTDLLNINGSNYVYKATLTDPGFDFEYYIEGTLKGNSVTYPVTGGNGTNNINKTVIRVTEIPFVPTEILTESAVQKKRQ